MQQITSAQPSSAIHNPFQPNSIPTRPTRVHGLHAACCVGWIDRRLLEQLIQPLHACHNGPRLAVPACPPGRLAAAPPTLGGCPAAGPHRCQQAAPACGAAALHVKDLCIGGQSGQSYEADFS